MNHRTSKLIYLAAGAAGEKAPVRALKRRWNRTPRPRRQALREWLKDATEGLSKRRKATPAPAPGKGAA